VTTSSGLDLGYSLASYRTEPESAALASTQWIELYNTDPGPQLMQGWMIDTRGGSYVFTDTMIGGYDYVELVWDRAYFLNQFPDVGAPVDEMTGINGAPPGLDPVSDHIVLRGASGEVISGISYGDDSTFYQAPLSPVAPGHALARKQPGLNTGNPSDFVDRAPAAPGHHEVVVPAPAPIATPKAQAIRNNFFTPITLPDDLMQTPVKVVAANLLLMVLLAAVFGICTVVLDNVIREEETSLQGLLIRIPVMNGMMKGLSRLSARETAEERTVSHALRVAVVLVLYALLWCLLDPKWTPLGPGSFYLFLVMLGTTTLVGFTETFSQAATLHHWGMRLRINFWPANLLTAGVVVALSRVIPLKPGVIFGAPGGLEYEEEALSEHRKRSLRWIGFWSLVGLVVVCWLGSLVFDQFFHALTPDPEPTEGLPLIMAGIRNFWLASFLAALQWLFFQLIPLANTYGRDIWSRSKLAWAALTIPIGTVLSRIILNPEGSPVEEFTLRPVQFMLAFMAIYAICTAIVWFYFNPHEDVLQKLHYRQWGSIFRRKKDESESSAK
jgi:hypothetical protein